MRPFAYERASDAAGAVQGFRAQPSSKSPLHARTQFLAGGTTLLDLMKLDVMRPDRLIDIRDLEAQHSRIEVTPEGLRLGALARMAVVGDDPLVRRDYPMIAEALNKAASAQIRNMATLGGNVLQRSRCSYFRDTSFAACNKREPGSGCSALKGVNRKHAVLGVSDLCISTYPGDFAQALAALGAHVDVLSLTGVRSIPFENLYRGPDQPEIETHLKPGELIIGFFVPAGPWTRRSLYLKIRDRQSYEHALSSAAVALHLDGDRVQAARIALGGVAYRPWRSHAAEAVLMGEPLTEANAERAAAAAFADAKTHVGNDYKPNLGRRTLVRALLQAAAMVV